MVYNPCQYPANRQVVRVPKCSFLEDTPKREINIYA
jgi:hypothetical protein